MWLSISRRSTRRCAELPTFDAGIDSKRRCAACAEARGVKAASLIHAVRVALTGKAVSPGLFEVLALLGRDARPRAPADAPRASLSPARIPEPAPSLFHSTTC